MSKKMLIDASRSDETRVVVMVDGRIEEIDHETADRRPIKSNIYLARVTRVEPSLQAAFVDYGGNRHGFLPFSEIHPDYYQLPVADREALMQEVEDKVEERRNRHANLQSSPRRGRSSAAASASVVTVDPDGEQPHVEFPVDENGDFIQPAPLTAQAVEVETPEAPAEEATAATVDLAPSDEVVAEAVADTDSVAATLGLSDTLSESAILDTPSKENEPTVSLTEAEGEETASDETPPKTVSAATGTDEEEAVTESVETQSDAEAESPAEEAETVEDEDVQVETEASEDDAPTASTDAEGGVEEVATSDDDEIEEAGSGESDDDDEDEDEGATAKSTRPRRRRRSRGSRKKAAAVEEEVSADDEDEGADRDDDDEDVSDDDEDEEDDIFDEDAERRSVMHSIISRRYKIQEVIKRRQVMLIQVTKEERGNKGAALSSYLSLAGRYCVYMPNTTRGGGISRKISSPKDRRRLKTILDDLDLPQDISIIVRTAGSQRTKAEIKRDYEYLRRTWDGIRENTLTSMAPSLIYEEANVMKRAIRDMYSSDMEEVLVEGDDGYKDAKNFMKVLTPSHAKRVQQHKNEGVSLFQRHKAEQQLDALFNPVVTLKSGGYLVMNQTEALVAVDVNSGKATKERSIEDTALATNLEAAEEVARQLRLRDLAGLVVIDFIDMDESKHRGQVERKLKESMRGDRARIQLGRISPFGLLELSRQRIRPSVFETTMVGCSVCGGIGVVRSSGSLASSIMRRVGDLLLERDSLDRIEVDAPTDAALKLLNDHREELANLESQFSVKITIVPNAHLFSPHFHLRVYTDEKMESFEEGYTSDPTAPKKGERRRGRRSNKSEESDKETSSDESSAEEGRGRGRRNQRGRKQRNENPDEAEAPNKDKEEVEASDEGEGDSKSRRQRGKRGGRRRTRKDAEAEGVTGEDVSENAEETASNEDSASSNSEAEGDGEGDKPKRRRGKRGGRNRRKPKTDEDGNVIEDTTAEGETDSADKGSDEEAKSSEESAVEDVKADEAAVAASTEEEAPAEKPKPKRKRAPRTPKVVEPAAETESEPEVTVEAVVEPEPAKEVKVEEVSKPEPEAEPEAAAKEAAIAATAEPEPDTPKKEGPRRRGWWSRGS